MNEFSQGSEPIYSQESWRWEAASAVIATVLLSLNSEAIGPIGEAYFATHVLVFGLIKEAYKAKTEGEYTKKDFLGALNRVAAPFITSEVIKTSIDQGALNLIPFAVTGVLSAITHGKDVAINIKNIAKEGAQYALYKSGEMLSEAYTRMSSAVSGRKDAFIANISEIRLQNPFGVQKLAVSGEFQSPIRLQNPVGKVEKWQFPIKFKKFWRRERNPE